MPPQHDENTAVTPTARGGATPPEEGARFKLLQEIGAGGMGKVYRARDLRLNRDVAIKFLPDWLAEDPTALHRFRREAQATASLNHPNVLAIYDQAVIDGAPCLVSELLEGRTLRRALAAGAIPLAEAIDYAQQTLDGLAAAHEKGIIHRDLKPENIFITRDNRVKILDFGLAKQAAAPIDPTLETMTAMPETKTGIVVGTLGYQSPEQARGEDVDARSDLFAFGAVLYELFTGQPAFRRRTGADTIAAVLHDNPPAPSSVNGEVPASCDAIVAKALEKDRELRYQSAAEVRADLRRVRRELSADSSQGASGSVVTRSAPPRSTRRTVVAAVATLGALALVGAALFLPAWRGGRNPFEGVAARQLTNAVGWEGDPSVSPDGTLVAYSAEDDNGNRHIFIIDNRNSAKRQLTDGNAADRYPCWTPDGSSVFFSSDRSGGGIFSVPSLGGQQPRLVLADAVEPAVSLDGKGIAFARRVAGADTFRIFVAPLDDPARARQVTTDNDGLWEHHRPSWSNDARSIVYRAHMAIWQVGADGKGARRLTRQSQSCDRPVWAPDGSIYYGSKLGGTFALWHLRAGAEEPERVTPGTGERDPSLSADGRVLAYAIATVDYNLVLHDLTSGVEQSYGGVRIEYLPALSPAGDEVFFVGDLDATGEQIWAVKIANGKFAAASARRITGPSGQTSRATCSPDGRWLVYYKIVGDQRSIWVVAASGGPPIRITSGRGPDTTPSWSPDGDRIAFASERDGHSHIWALPVSDGKPAGKEVRLTSGATADEAPVWSPDGRSIAYVGAASDGRNDVWVIPSDGGSAARRVTTGAGAWRVQWEPGTGKLLVAAWWGTHTLSVRRIDEARGTWEPLEPPLLLGSNEYLYDFDVSKDGRWAVFSRDDSRSNIWLFDARPPSR